MILASLTSTIFHHVHLAPPDPAIPRCASAFGRARQLSQEQEVHKKEAADVLAEAPGAWDDLGLTPKETPSPGKRMKTDTPKAREVFMALTLEKRTPWC